MPSVSPCWMAFPLQGSFQSSTVRTAVYVSDWDTNTSYAVQADSSSDDELMPAADGFPDRFARSIRGLLFMSM